MKKFIYAIVISTFIFSACTNNNPVTVEETANLADFELAKTIDTSNAIVEPFDYKNVESISWDSVEYYITYKNGNTTEIIYITDDLTMECLVEFSNMYENNYNKFKRQLYVDMFNSFLVLEHVGNYRLLYCPEYFE